LKEERSVNAHVGPVSAGAFAQFYLPLAATSLLLTATNPVLAAALARSPDPAAALAGYSVAFALCGVLYSPLLVVQQVAASRMLDGGSIAPVWRFGLATGVAFSVIAAAAGFTPFGEWIFRDLIGVTGHVYAEAIHATRILWPAPLITTFRALHQGRLVAGHRTRPIAMATGLRTLALTLVAFALAWISGGAWIGAVAFMVGLTLETLIVWGSRSEPPRVRPATEEQLRQTGERLLRFTVPLMVNVLLWWSTPLIINGVLARTPFPETAIAGFAIVEALAWFVAAPTGQLQHASIALVNCSESHASVRKWGVLVAIGVSALLGILALPGVREPILATLFSLEPNLLRGAAIALPLAAVYPLLYAHRQYYQGLFVRAGQPLVVGWGAVLRLTTILAAAGLLLPPLGRYGAALGVCLAVIGLIVEDAFLERLSHKWALPQLSSPGPVPEEVLAPEA
jgi:O-antigen/teichoic acid export membrane protein